MSKGQITRGSTVLISGIGGGVALFSLQFAVAAGANVYVTSSDPEKIKRAVQMGAKGGVNYKNSTWAKELLSVSPAPFDVVIDGAGNSDSISSYLKLLRVGGKLVTYGATSSPTANILLPTLFLKQIQLLGTTMGNETEFGEMISFVERHRIRPIVSGVWEGLEAGEGAFEEMRKAKQFGKLVIRIRADDEKVKL